MFDDRDKKFEIWLKEHKYIYKFAYACHLSSKPFAFIAVVLAILIAFITIGGIIFLSDETEPIPEQNNGIEITNLKNYTLNKCQDVREFLANRESNKPEIEDFGDWHNYNLSDEEAKKIWNDYNKASGDYGDETMRLFKDHHSQNLLRCYYEFGKLGYSNTELERDIKIPTNRLVIEIDIIPGLELLASNL